MTRTRRVLVGILGFFAALIGVSVLVVLAIAGWIGIHVMHGPARLAAEKQALLRDGCPVEPQLFQKPLPPADQNAAPDYEKLLAIFDKHPFTPDEDNLFADAASSGQKLKPADRAHIRTALAKHAAILALIHHAAARPECIFSRNWDAGPGLMLPEYAPMREATRILGAESYLLASDGQFQKAVQTQSLGFKVAEHAGSDPIMIAYLVDIACDAITLRGLEQILAISGGRADVDEEVYQSIAANHPRIDLHESMKGEVVMAIGCDRMIRDQMARGISLTAAIRWMAGPPNGEVVLPPLPAGTPHRTVRSPMLDAMTAELLRYDRQELEATLLPARQRIEAMSRPGNDLEARNQQALSHLDPTLTLASILVPVFSQAGAKEIFAHAKEAAVEAKAKVLEYRAVHGSLPDSLDQAIAPVPQDPWSDKPLLYRREGAGFVIYSVGQTGHFDGGKPGVKIPGEETAVRFPFPATLR